LTPTASDDTGDEYLGLGLADALITRLSGLRRFVVRPTSSVLRFGGRDAGDPLEAGRKLGVAFVLDARIQHAGEKLRVTAQMLELATGATRWAEIFDERFADILDLQDRIAMRVAESITPHLSGDERQQLAKRGTDNAQAFEAYLRGRYYWNTFTEEGFAKAINCYHQAIAYDESYALPYTGIADYFNWLGVYGVLPSNECCAASKEAATRAIELDPNLAEAYTTLAFALHTGFDWRHQEQLHLRALELSPNYATAHVWYSLQLTMEGRFDEALREARRAIELDPLNSFSQHHLGWVLYHARRYDESIAHYERMFLAEPRYGIARFSYAWALRQVGRCDEAIDEARRAVELMGDNPFVIAGLGAAYARAGRTEEARSILHQLEAARAKRYVSPYHLALICCNLGDAECAFQLLEQALSQRDFWVVWLGIEPQFDVLRTDSRYADLLRRINYPGATATPREEFIINALPTNQTIDSLADKTADDYRKTESAAAGASSHIKVADADQAHADQSKLLPLASLARHSVVWRVCAVLAVLCCCVALALFLRSRTTSAPGATTGASATNPLEANAASNTEKRSLAVLPFTTVGASGDDQYLGVGLADLVTNKLSSLEAVSVRTSNAVRRYLNTKSASIDVGRELGVDYVLSGAVTRDGEWMHTRLELSDVRANRVLWSEITDEPFVDIIALQDSVSERIANALKLRLTSDERNRLRHRYTENSAAYQLYLAGRYHLGKRTADGLRQAITSFEQASQRDARFALAYAGLADSYALLNWYIEPPPADAFRRAKEAAIKAVELDSELAEAHASLAFIRFHYDRDSAGAAEEFRRAIMLKPNYPTAHHWYALALSATGQHDEALREVRRAEELDPRSAIIATAVANVLYHARRFDEAIAQCRKALELDPGAVGAHVVMRWAYERLGRYDEAFAVFEKERAFAGDTPTTRAKRAHVLAAAGRGEEARNILHGLLADRAQQWVTPYEIAVIYALLNDHDAALAWLERAEREHVVGFTFVQVDPHLDSLRDDPRFTRLLHTVSQKQ